MRNVFVTIRFGADTRARFDAETLELQLVTDTGGEFLCGIIPLADVEHVLTQIGKAWELGQVALENLRREAAAASLDNVTPFKRPDGA